MLERRRGLIQSVLIKDVDVDGTFTSRVTANGKKINRSLAEIQSIKGNTLLWNQMLNTESEQVYQSAFTSNVTKPFNVKPSLNDEIYISADLKKSTNYAASATNNRLVLCNQGNTYGGEVNFSGVAKDNVYHRIYGKPTNNNASNSSLGVQCFQYSAGSVTIKNMMALNLTRMFGDGNEPTATQFKNLFPLDFYTQNSGSLLNFTAAQLISKDNSLTVIDTLDLNITTLTGRTGKPQNWNQLLENGDFSNNGSSGWTKRNSSTSVTDNVVTVVKSSASGTGIGGIIAHTIPNLSTSHKYYLSSYNRTNTSGTGMVMGFHASSGSVSSNTTVSNGSEVLVKKTLISSPKANTNLYTLRIGSASSASGVSGSATKCMCIDLTLIYGAGNEPSDPAVFEADYYNWVGQQLDFEPYDDGTQPQDNAVVIFPDGMKSVGNVYDEIVKENDRWVAYVRIGSRAYTSGDESDSTVVTDGTTTYYQLDKPLRYIINNPIPYLYEVCSLGVEMITPNTAAPVTSPAKMNIRYKTTRTLFDINVTQSHTNLTNNKVKAGGGYSTYVTVDSGFMVSQMTIEMGGVDITSTVWDSTNSTITISSVTDDVDIDCICSPQE